MRIHTPYPVYHRECRLASTYLEPGQIAGILDGDGAFTLLRRRSGTSIRIRPQVALVMRDDDPTPLAVWASMAARRGRPMGTLIRSRTYRRHEWRVDRLDDIVELTDWLARNPLLSPRGYRQLAMVREAALILLRSRVPGGGARRLPAADAARLLELRAQIPARGQPAARLSPSPVADFVSADHRGWVLAGLVAAEGCFSLRSERSKRAHHFALGQRIDNLALLEGYRSSIGGAIRVYPGRGRSSPVAQWVITRLADCTALVAVLREYPVPPCSPKASQFEVWADSLLLRRPERRPAGVRIGKVAALVTAAETLAVLKQYRGPRLLCNCTA